MANTRIPLKDRSIVRTKGCWNCKSAAAPADGLAFWKTEKRPQDDARVAQLKLKLADVPAGKDPKLKGRRSALLKLIEATVRPIDAFEKAIGDGLVVRCTNKLCPDKSDFKSHRFLCDQWSGVTGAKLAATAGGSLLGDLSDALPAELKDRFGDGN